MKRYFLGVGNTNDINCWSGTAHFILKSAKKSSFNLQGIDLNYKKLYV